MSSLKNPRYIVLSGWITSSHDGDRHFISSRAVSKLVGVNPKDCLFLSREKYNFLKERNLLPDNAQLLYPKSSGNYNIESFTNE